MPIMNVPWGSITDLSCEGWSKKIGKAEMFVGWPLLFVGWPKSGWEKDFDQLIQARGSTRTPEDAHPDMITKEPGRG